MKTLEQLWLDEYVDPELGLCGLCGNSGTIDTRGRALSHAGVDAGGLHFCICPNGRAMKEAGWPLKRERRA